MTGEVGVEDQTRAGGGLGVQRAAAGRWAILNIETKNRETHNIFDILYQVAVVIAWKQREITFEVGFKIFEMLIFMDAQYLS